MIWTLAVGLLFAGICWWLGGKATSKETARRAARQLAFEEAMARLDLAIRRYDRAALAPHPALPPSEKEK